MLYHAILDIHMLLYMPVSSPLKKKETKTPTTNNTQTGSQGGILVITIRNFLLLVVVLLLIQIPMFGLHERPILPSVKGQGRRIILFTLVLVQHLMFSLHLALMPWVTQGLSTSRSELPA